MSVEDIRSTFNSLRIDTLVAGRAAKVAVDALDEVPANELSRRQRRDAKKAFKSLTWVGVQELSLVRIAQGHDSKQIDTVENLIHLHREVGGQYVRRPDGTYAWLPLNQHRIDALKEMLSELTGR